MYKKILLGIDESDNAMKAVEKVIDIQKQFNSEVVVFHSVLHQLSEITPTFSINMSSNQVVSYQIERDRVKQSQGLLDEIKKKFKESNIDIETRLIYQIGPEYYIKNQVEEEGFDLVVLGCEGQHSKLRRTVLGTVPEYVINNAKCDVLIIK